MLANCTRCGKVFQKIPGRKICPLCQEADEAAFSLVNQYVGDHPGAEVAEVAEKTGVEEALVLRFLRDGRFATSGGLTAGMDLALALVEEDLGATAALDVARQLVMYMKRPGNQAQFSTPLAAQARSSGRMDVAFRTSRTPASRR